MPVADIPDDDYDAWDFAHPTCDFEINDPVIIGELLGPDGQPIAYLLDRPAVQFGFQPPRHPPPWRSDP